MTSAGCPFDCGHCYNSVRVKNLENEINRDSYDNLARALGGEKARLFPKYLRPVKEIIKEVENILEISPETKLIFDQSDVHGVKLTWLREFSKEFSKLGIGYHALMRFEYINPKRDANKERIYLMKKAGCTGLTFAIESGIPQIRDEILGRQMNEDMMFESFSYLKEIGFKVRTQQMLGLPYGATIKETLINIDADLETLKLNVELLQETGLPTMAWASIYTPYLGTSTGDYCKKHGFYLGNNNDIKASFFEKSVLRFPKQWVGPKLSLNMKDVWLNEPEQELYRNQLIILRDTFAHCARIKNGDKLARKVLDKEDFSNPTKYSLIGNIEKAHLYDNELYCVE